MRFNLEPARVLIVDDEPLVLEMLQTFLREKGFDVFIASDSASARWCIQHVPCHVFLCDILLGDPDCDGFQLVAEMNAAQPTAKSILITGHPSQDDEQRADEVGAVYITKPVALDALVAMISNLVSAPSRQASA